MLLLANAGLSSLETLESESGETGLASSEGRVLMGVTVERLRGSRVMLSNSLWRLLMVMVACC